MKRVGRAPIHDEQEKRHMDIAFMTLILVLCASTFALGWILVDIHGERP
jgi:hypothetical protein